MKQQILNLKKKLLLVEMPEGAYNVKVRFGNYLTYFKPFSKVVAKFDFNIKEVGKLTYITEEQFQNWVEKLMQDQHFQNYNWQGVIIDRWVKTAKESFFSYLQANGVYFENPLGEKPDGTPILFSQRNGALELLEWEEAEQKVWNKDLIYIFELI
jgi:hypothetical protein